MSKSKLVIGGILYKLYHMKVLLLYNKKKKNLKFV